MATDIQHRVSPENEFMLVRAPQAIDNEALTQIADLKQPSTTDAAYTLGKYVYAFHNVRSTKVL